MDRYRYLPATVALLAGLIVSVVMILNSYELLAFLWILAVVLVCFYLVGVIIRNILIKILVKQEEEEAAIKKAREEEEEAKENALLDEAEKEEVTE